MSHIGAWILEDQCSHTGSAIEGLTAGTPLLLIEDIPYLSRYPHHWQKLVLLISAQRHFAAELARRGFNVTYHKMCLDPIRAVNDFIQQFNITELRLMEPNDYPRAMSICRWQLPCRLTVTDNKLFLNSNAEFARYAAGKKQLVMEFFYRQMRKKLDLLLDKNGEPIGGAWNFDRENRAGRIPPQLSLPDLYQPKIDAVTREAFMDVRRGFAGKYFGRMPTQPDGEFIWPVTHDQAVEQLESFLHRRLEHFGRYEDAMTLRSWSVFHSHLSPAMNCGLLHPAYIVDRIRSITQRPNGTIPLNSLEGFARQIIGWREFMRGIYWREMTGGHAVAYPQRNELDAHHPLPEFYWSGQSDMACINESLKPVLRYAYSHHIPRLMVLANFALLHGLNPQAVNEWFTYAYADGYDWVTAPNVIGMALYADGGIVATKPYAAGGAYIHRMSDYCELCPYDPNLASGPQACPFTRAYWPFIARHAQRLAANPRTSLAVRALNRLSQTEIGRRAEEAQRWLVSLPIYTSPNQAE